MGPLTILVVTAGLLAVVVVIGRARSRGVRTELRAFAARLDEGRVIASARLFGGIGGYSVRGRRKGRQLRFTVDIRGFGKHKETFGVFKVSVRHPCGRFDLERRAPLSQLGRWITGTMGEDAFADAFHEKRRRRGALQSREVQRALRHLVEAHGFVWIELAGDGLLAERYPQRWGEISRATLDRQFGALERVARLCERRRLRVKVSPRVRAREGFGWTGGGAGVLCPYCRVRADPAAADLAVCEVCGTLHHAACYAELGQCTIFGCQGREAAPIGA